MEKVFGLGFHRTGTTTLNDVLRRLGYNVCPNPLAYSLINDWINDDFKRIILVSKKYNGFEDSPWFHPELYKVLHDNHPNAKFVLTVREPNLWFESLVYQLKRFKYDLESESRWFQYDGYTAADLYIKIYGTAPRNKGGFLKNKYKFISAYKSHNKNVVKFFNKKNLLVVDWSKESGWSSICNFLNKPVISGRLPHKNKGRT